MTKIRNRYNQVPHLTQDINVKVTNSLLDITNESQEVSPFPAGDHKPSKTDAHESITDTCKKKYRLRTVMSIFCSVVCPYFPMAPTISFNI